MTTTLDVLKQQLVPVLEQALNTESKSVRDEAEHQLTNAERHNFHDFLRALAKVVGDDSFSLQVRILAALRLKNGVSGHSAASVYDRQKRDRYKSLAEDARKEIKINILLALESNEVEVSRAACQVVSRIARLELITGDWPELIPKLQQFHQASSSWQELSFIAMHYILEDLYSLQTDEEDRDPGKEIALPDDIINALLPLIVSACQQQNTVVPIKIVALRALSHALYFIHGNMSDPTQQNTIIESIIINLQTTAPEEVQQAAWECCVFLATEYYLELENWITKLAPASIAAIQCDDETIATFAIEFWSSLADMELMIEEENAAILASGSTTEAVNQNINLIPQVQSALNLVEVLLYKLIKEDLEDTAAGWTVDMAAGSCLCLIAQLLKDDVVDTVVAFVNKNFGSTKPVLREAAVMAYASIMKGPSSEKLLPIVHASLEALIRSLNDPEQGCRDSSAWCIGRICENHPSVVMNLLGDTANRGLIHILIEKMSDMPRVAAFACFAVYCIADYVFETESDVLDPFFPDLAKALLQAGRRSDEQSKALLTSPAYECLSKVIHCTSPRSQGFGNYLAEILQQLTQLLSESVKVVSNDEVQRIQTFVTGCAQTVLQRYFVCFSFPDKTQEQQELDALIQNVSCELLQICCIIIKAGTVHTPESHPTEVGEEVIMPVMTIETVLPDLTKPIPDALIMEIHSIIRDGLSNPKKLSYNKGCINVVRAITQFTMGVFPSENVMNAIVAPLINDLFCILDLPAKQADISLKPIIMTVLGDVAMSCGVPFILPFSTQIINYLRSASSVKIDADSPYEWKLYVHELRYSICIGYAGILYSMQNPVNNSNGSYTQAQINDNLEQTIQPNVAAILNFLTLVFEDDTSTPDILQQALGIAGDLLIAFRKKLLDHLTQSYDAFLPLVERRCRTFGHDREPNDAVTSGFQFLQHLVTKFGSSITTCSEMSVNK